MLVAFVTLVLVLMINYFVAGALTRGMRRRPMRRGFEVTLKAGQVTVSPRRKEHDHG